MGDRDTLLINDEILIPSTDITNKLTTLTSRSSSNNNNNNNATRSNKCHLYHFLLYSIEEYKQQQLKQEEDEKKHILRGKDFLLSEQLKNCLLPSTLVSKIKDNSLPLRKFYSTSAYIRGKLLSSTPDNITIKSIYQQEQQFSSYFINLSFPSITIINSVFQYFVYSLLTTIINTTCITNSHRTLAFS